jgi:predicted DsbA family dithiol-disulfide isomerase
VTDTLDQNRAVRTLHIDVWSDFVCPICYLAKPRLDDAIAKSGLADSIELSFHAFELFPDAPDEPFDSFEHVLHKFGGNAAMATQVENRLLGMAQEQGQPYSIHHPIGPSIDAHRVLKLASEFGVDSEFIDSVQRDLLGNGIDIYHADYLTPTAVAHGIPEARVAALLSGGEYLAEVQADILQARELGVSSVPFTVFDLRSAIPGAVGTVDYLRAIQAVWERTDSSRAESA